MPSDRHFVLLSDGITPELRRLIQQGKHAKSILGAGAKAVQLGLVRHLRELQSRGNQMGWPSQKFFAGGPDSVQKHVGLAELTDQKAVVSIADPRFIHRIDGGEVGPKRGKMLAIPLTAEAYAAGGKGTIRETFPGLMLVKTPKGLFLVRPGGASGVTSVLFRLVPKATQRPHPEEEPNREKLAQSARGAMEKAAKILVKAQ